MPSVSKYPLYITCPINQFNSVGRIGLDILNGLRAQDYMAYSSAPFHIGERPFIEHRHLHRTLPNLFQFPDIPKYNIISMHWELENSVTAFAQNRAIIVAPEDSALYYKDTMAIANRYDVQLTFSSWALENITKRGFKNPRKWNLHVPAIAQTSEIAVPYNKMRWSNIHGTVRLNEFSTVFFIGGHMQWRKGISAAIAAYKYAYAGRSDVLLWVHGRLTSWGKEDWLKDMSLTSVDSPPMMWTNYSITDAELYNILSQVTYVSCHHTEGFGYMPALNAAGLRKPIVSCQGGPMDWANKDNAILLKGKMRYGKTPSSEIPTDWIEYKQRDLEDCLRMAEVEKSGAGIGKNYSLFESTRSLLMAIDFPIAKHPASKEGLTSLLIPCRKSPVDLRRLLGSLYSTPAGAPFECIVLLEEMPKFTSNFPARLIYNNESRGISVARNLLIDEARGEYAVTMDCDIEFIQPNWLAMWLEEYKRIENKIGIAPQLSPMILYPGGKINSCGTVNFDICAYMDMPVSNVNSRITEIEYCHGACCMRRTAMLREYPFHPAFTFYFEDSDASHYMALKGHKCFVTPQIRVVHHEHSTARNGVINHPVQIQEARKVFKSFWPNLVD